MIFTADCIPSTTLFTSNSPSARTSFETSSSKHCARRDQPGRAVTHTCTHTMRARTCANQCRLRTRSTPALTSRSRALACASSSTSRMEANATRCDMAAVTCASRLATNDGEGLSGQVREAQPHREAHDVWEEALRQCYPRDDQEPLEKTREKHGRAQRYACPCTRASSAPPRLRFVSCTHCGSSLLWV